MKLMPLIASSALCLAGATAMAAGGPIDLSSGSASFGSTPVAGAFSDVYTFSLASPANVNGSVTTVVNGAQDIDFTSMTIAGPGGLFAFSLINPDPFETWALASTLLAAGNYTLTLVGVNSSAIASYGGNLAASVVSNVPEPQVTALLLAGLGVLGFVGRRRRR